MLAFCNFLYFRIRYFVIGGGYIYLLLLVLYSCDNATKPTQHSALQAIPVDCYNIKVSFEAPVLYSDQIKWNAYFIQEQELRVLLALPSALFEQSEFLNNSEFA